MSTDLQLDYQPAEDRLVLTLADATGARRFWLTRRQCVALAVACRSAQGEAPPLKMAPPVRARAAAGLASPGDAEAAPQLIRMALRHNVQSLRMTLTGTAAKPVSLLLKPADQLGLLRTLRHLASRAQWDLDAAESRAAANAMMQRAKSSLH